MRIVPLAVAAIALAVVGQFSWNVMAAPIAQDVRRDSDDHNDRWMELRQPEPQDQGQDRRNGRSSKFNQKKDNNYW